MRRRCWADYFDQQGIRYAFYSAALGIAIQEARREAAEALENGQAEDEEDDDEDESSDEEDEEEQPEQVKLLFAPDDDDEDTSDPRIKILSVPELEALFVEMAPPLSGE